MVSIITITYNRSQMIGNTIRSVLNQSYHDFEYIIVDDGSSDNTKAIVENFSDKRIKYFYLPHTGKLSLLRNFSMNKSSGDLIGFIDSDDTWEESKLLKQVQLMNSYPEAGYSFTDVRINGNKTEQEGIYQQEESLFPTDYFSKIISGLLIICPVALLFRKTCLETVSMLDEEMVSGDNDFIIRLALNHKGILIPEQLININRHEDNHSTQYAIQSYYENINTLEKLFRQDKISKSIYREMKSRHYYRAGLHGIREKKYLQARTDFLKSFFSLPTNVKALIRSFQCLFYSF